jgi:hypothetical protein
VALADIFLGRAGGPSPSSTARQSAKCTLFVRRASPSSMSLLASESASWATSLSRAKAPLLRFAVRGKRHASFSTDFEYRSEAG